MAKKIQKHTKRKKITSSAKGQPKRKRTARESTKNAALQKRFFSKIKQEYHDIDYVDQLNDKEKAFLNSFMEEELNARFNHSGKKLYKKKSEKKRSMDANNARNRDLYSISKATNAVVDVDPEWVIEQWQMTHSSSYSPNETSEPNDIPTLLSKLEFKKLLKSGAHIPEDMFEFYKKRYPKLFE